MNNTFNDSASLSSNSDPNVNGVLNSITPVQGHLVHLKTRAELQARDETIDVYVCEIAVKETSKRPEKLAVGSLKPEKESKKKRKEEEVTSSLDSSALRSIPNHNTNYLYHLRRVVKRDRLPRRLLEIKQNQNHKSRKAFDSISSTNTGRSSTDLAQPLYQQAACQNSNTGESNPTDPANQEEGTETAYILLLPISQISKEALSEHLQYYLVSLPTSHSQTTTHSLLTTPVPLHPPSSASQAQTQSCELWPTLYNPNTSYGPNPSMIQSAQEEIKEDAAWYLSLAREIGRESKRKGRGEGVGVVVVERAPVSPSPASSEKGEVEMGKGGEIFCVAGDARYHPNHYKPSKTRDDEPKINKTGDPSNHAVMRAISFVARKRRSLSSLSSLSSPNSNPNSTTNPAHPPQPKALAPALSPQEDPLTNLEQHFLSHPNNLKPNGYLCLNLEFYLTHECCIMCSMALVHSRAGKVVFCSEQEGYPNKRGNVTPAKGDGSNIVREEAKNKNTTHKNQKNLYTSSQKQTQTPKQKESKPRKSGGLHAEEDEKGKLGYGLFWRKELNWRFLCWKFVLDRDRDKGDNEVEVEVEDGEDRGDREDEVIVDGDVCV